MSAHESGRDVGDMVRRLAPERDRSFLAPGQDPVADALLARIVTTPVRPRRKWRFGVTIVAATLVVGAGVTAAVLSSRTPDNPTEVVCHSSSDPLTADATGLAATRDVHAVDACAELWRDGTYSTDGPPDLSPASTTPAQLPCFQARLSCAGSLVGRWPKSAQGHQRTRQLTWGRGWLSGSEGSAVARRKPMQLCLRYWKICV